MRIDFLIGLVRTVIVFVMVLGLSIAVGCGGDDDDGAGGAGSDGAGAGGDGAGIGGADGDGAGADGGGEGVCDMNAPCPDQNPPFENPCCRRLKGCPEIPPMQGNFAPKGACCFRMPAELAAREVLEPGEPGPLGFVMTYYRPVTQPASVGSDMIAPFLKNSRDLGYDTTLVRIDGVVLEEDATGPLDVQFSMGSGRIHCDGSFSFYGEGAAPDYEGRTDPDRWNVHTQNGVWDWEADPYFQVGDDRYTGLAWAPRWVHDDSMIETDPDTGETIYPFDYEQPIRVMDISFPNSSRDAEGNCIGSMDMDGNWTGPPAMTTFVPMQEAEQTISALTNQSLCSVIANSVGGKENPDDPGRQIPFTCEGPRVGGDNPWVEPPDSMCPTDPTDETPCWIGVKDHPDFDPERDCNDTDRPCCDPEAEVEDGGCNAWFTKSEIALAAVGIRTVGTAGSPLEAGKKYTWRDFDFDPAEERITNPEDSVPPDPASCQ